MTRQLILTADDFGFSPEVDEGILLACRDGALRHASLMVGEEPAEEAASRAKTECPELSVGLHVVLTHGRAVSPLSARSLAPGGLFPPAPAFCGARYFFRKDLAPALERELRAQFERFLSWGLPPSHVDGHANIHVHPVVFPMLLRLAEEYGFRRIRLPGGELGRSLSYRVGPLASQLLNALVFSALRRRLLACRKHSKVFIPDRTWGLLRSGLMSEDYLLHLLKGLPDGVTEIYFHSRLELEALRRPRVKAAIQAEGIELI